jgi:hypothetical protein
MVMVAAKVMGAAIRPRGSTVKPKRKIVGRQVGIQSRAAARPAFENQ